MARSAWPAALLAAIAFAGLGFLIWHPDRLFNRHSDLLAENLATQQLLFASWHSGEGIPLWRADLYSGAPALTNPQSLYTHPLHQLFAIFPPGRVVGLVIWLQMLVAALGAYVLAGTMGMSRSARLFTGVAALFSIKTILAAYAGWLTVLAGVAAMPWFFAALVALVDKPATARALAAGLAGALLLHSGHPQLPYYAGLAGALVAGGHIVRLVLHGRYAHARHSAAALAGAAAIAVGLSAYLLVPLLTDLSRISRSAASYDFFIVVPWPLRGLLTVVNPEQYGSPLDNSFVGLWEVAIYFGAVPSLLLVAGAMNARSSTAARLLLAGLVVTMAAAIDSPFVRVLYHTVPGYWLFRLPARVLFLSALFGFCLAGIGLDRVRAAARTARVREGLTALLLAATVLEGMFWTGRYLDANPPVPFPPDAELAGDLTTAYPSRIAPMSESVLNYGSAASVGLELVTGYDPFNFREYQKYMDVLRYGRPVGDRAFFWLNLDRIARHDLLAALNVRYVVSPKPVDLPADDFVLEHVYLDQPQFVFYQGMTTGPVYVYRNERFLQRAFFVSAVTRADDEAAMIDGVLHADVRDTAVALGADAGPSTPHPDDSVVVRETGSGSRRIDTHASARRFLVVSEVWNPGWRARVDGRDATLHRTDIALQGLWLDAGDHTIELTFWPAGLTLGLVITAITATGVCAAILLLVMRRRAR